MALIIGSRSLHSQGLAQIFPRVGVTLTKENLAGHWPMWYGLVWVTRIQLWCPQEFTVELFEVSLDLVFKARLFLFTKITLIRETLIQLEKEIMSLNDN